MTPDAWRVSADPYAMLDFLFPIFGSGSTIEQPRKLRLYYCALARIVWPELPAPMRATVEAAEHFADSEDVDQRVALLRSFLDHMHHFEGHPDDLAEWNLVLRQNDFSSSEPVRKPRWNEADWRNYYLLVASPLKIEMPNLHWIPRPMHRADLIRDVFESPALAPRFESSWCRDAIVTMAKEMYRERDFTPMPILADVLEEFGCVDATILNHCRDCNHVHVRGCWVVDRILSKKANDTMSTPA